MLVEYLVSEGLERFVSPATLDAMVNTALDRYHTSGKPLRGDDTYVCRLFVGDEPTLVVFFMFLDPETGKRRHHIMLWSEAVESGLDKIFTGMVHNDSYCPGIGKVLFPHLIPKGEKF